MKTCLVVDDLRLIRKVARQMLETMDFTVEEAADGCEALKHCRAKVPDLVLLDANMPVMTGMDFLRALADAPGEPRPKVVFCTTQKEPATIRAAMAAGADEFLTKPFDRNSLRSTLETVGVV